MITLKHLHTENAPQAVGPYSQAVKSGNLVFISGQLPLDPASGDMVKGDVGEQAKRCMHNILAILGSENLTAANLVKTTIYLKDMNDFSLVNEAYATFFDGKYPARACVEVARLPKDATMEIEAIACC